MFQRQKSRLGPSTAVIIIGICHRTPQTGSTQFRAKIQDEDNVIGKWRNLDNKMGGATINPRFLLGDGIGQIDVGALWGDEMERV